MLLATMNPCPCGYYGDPSHECGCSQKMIQEYQKKLSGPLLDRIDLFVQVARVPRQDLTSTTPTDHPVATEWRQAIVDARHRSEVRQHCPNAGLSNKQLQQLIHFSPAAKKLLDDAMDKLGLSARGYFKTMRVATTIADLDRSDTVTDQHVAEALQFRQIKLIR